MDADKLLEEATAFYLGSKDFNGYPCHHVRRTSGMSAEELRPVLAVLVERGSVALEFGDRHPNPHIRAFRDEPPAQQLAKLDESSLDHTCIYPTSQHLSSVVDQQQYPDRPYTLEVALGAGQLEFRAFDLSVLEIYRNDPRYYYENDDLHGSIGISDEYDLSPDIPEKDKVFLQTFGFAYDDDLNRAVAVFCTYLRRLSPEHQQIWHSKELEGDFRLHPDYFRACILGEFPERMSVFSAFVEELRLINEMCAVMGRPHLFRDDFQQSRPRNFSFLVRPTLNEFNNFVLTLDRMLSDNINKKFFMGEVPDETEEQRSDGKTIVRQRGTITMLQDWLHVKFRTSDPKPMTDLIIAFKNVRKQRQPPAHSLKPDAFDQSYFHSQRSLVMEAYHAVRMIRLILANHPAVRAADLAIPDLLYEGQIWAQ